MSFAASVGRLLPALGLVAALLSAQDSRAARQAAMETIKAEDLKKHLSVIASDEMRGRKTPSKELTAAATYIAAELERAGAKPAAPGGGWLQKKSVTVAAFDVASARGNVVIEGVEVPLEPGKNVDLVVRGSATASVERAPVVVVAAEALKAGAEDELAGSGAPLKGSLVLVALAKWDRSGDPLEHYLARAEAVGAAGCVLVNAGYAEIAGVRGYRQARLAAQQLKRERRAGRAPVIGLAVEDESLAAHLLARVEALATDSRPRAIPAVTVSVSIKMTESPVDVSNVIGSVEAEPGPLAAEAVVFTAHYDHIGMVPPVEGDWVKNGADDDGSGTVSLIELAEAFSAMKPRPARRIVFCAFFGEEIGGLGSQFYAENPAHPMDKTVCDINIEMIGRSFKVGPKVAWVTGYEYSNLGPILAEGAAEIGVKVIPDPYPAQNFFLRSDNVAFVRAKVPGHSISAGSTHADYHGVNDEVDRIEFDNMEQLVRGIFLGAARIADGSRSVRWVREIPRVR